MSELLDAIAARIDAATEGPWLRGEIQHFSETGYHVTYTDVEPSICAGLSIPDAELIAHARTDLPRLLAAVRAVEAVHQESDRQCLNYSHTNPDVMCPECHTVCETCDRTFPCPTVRGIEEALRGY